ncbi:LysR family transcriptional regulator [Dongia sp.]|uniref:LysR family transcriptional regulator n=2 Tax=Alphaproteobacteria TaxID=28211 RepID=UPI0035B1EB10
MARHLNFPELRHLRYFLESAKNGSFRKASNSIGIQESTISRCIRDLEDQLGVSLFQRTNGGVRLTVAGERFRGKAQAILKQVDDGLSDVSLTGCGVEGLLRIGLVAPIASRFLKDLLGEFSKNHEGVQIELVEGDPTTHIKAIRDFDLDIAFITDTFPCCECDSMPLWSERIYTILPQDHPLSNRAELSWPDLTREIFFIAETGLRQELHGLLTKRLAEVGYRPTVLAQNVGCDNLLTLVAIGRGILLATESMAERCSLGIVQRLISDEVIPFAAVWSPRNDNPAFRRFLSIAKARRSRKTELNASQDQ